MDRDETLQKAQEEFDKLRQWLADEDAKVEEKLKREGRWGFGLDGSANKEFIPNHEEYRRRIKEIKKKYGIPEKGEDET